MSVAELKTLIQQRKWYHFSEILQKCIKNTNSIDEALILVKLFTENVTRLHPQSIAAVSRAIFENVKATDSIGAIEKAIETLRDIPLFDEPSSQELIMLTLLRCTCAIQLGDFSNIEYQLISYKSASLSLDNRNLLNLVFSFFYEAVGNIENAQEFLLRHAKQTKKVVDIEKLVKLSILSKTFYDFAVISSFSEFESIQNKDLKEIFIALMNGDISKINEKAVCSVLNVNNASFLIEKAYLVNIIALCFHSEQKCVYFDDFISVLKVDETKLIELLLKTLGLKVVSGWIDCESRTFFFNSVLTKSLNNEELTKMKYKFIEWRSRIEKVIEIMEN